MSENEKKVAAGTAENGGITEEKEKAVLEKYDREAKTRTFVNPTLAMAFKVFCIVVTAYHLIFAAGIWTPRTLQHRSIHVAMMLILSFAMYPATKKASRRTIAWYDYILMALSAVTAIYMYVNYNTIVNRAGVVNGTDVIVGAILTVLVLEATRRVCGAALPILSLIFILYALMGRRAGMIPINIPGIFLHRGYTLPKMFSNFYTNTEGIYGSSVNVASTYIFLFICFGEFMNKCGMGKFFNDIATALAGWSKGGPAKVAIIAAGLLGMINGAAVAVVVTTGSFTIPLMKKDGYDNEFAGAVVATGSVGGQLMPPVMGAAAFIMAETLGIKYNYLLVCAIIPAVIYYLGILFQIQLRADRLNMKPTPREELPKISQVMKESGHLAIPIIFLVYMLFFSGKTVIMAAFYSIICTIVIAELRKNTRMSLNDIINALAKSATSTVSVAIACACVGCIVGVCSITGFALNLANAIVMIGQNSLLFTLVFSMVTCMILGMGLPSIPAYIITSTVAAPALVQLGIPDIAAHMFCFYFAMFANLTPPVALASFAAAGISGGDAMKTGWASVKLALAGFILPYMFVYNNSLLLIGQKLNQDTGKIEVVRTGFASGAITAVFAIIGVALLSIAVEGHLFKKVSLPLRVLAIVGAFLLMTPTMTFNLVGIAIAAAVIVVQKASGGKATPAAA